MSVLYSLSATLIPVGLSAIIKVDINKTFNQAGLIKIVSGNGVLEIVPTPLALTGASAAGWNSGYPIGASESVAFNGPCTFYLAATGATMVAGVLIGKSAGASLI